MKGDGEGRWDFGCVWRPLQESWNTAKAEANDRLEIGRDVGVEADCEGRRTLFEAC